MGHPTSPTTAEDLLAHAGWLRALALRLVRDRDVADDLVQETWIATLHHPPERDRPVRPWLAKVMRNVLRMRARGDGRRTAREQATLIATDDVPSPDVLVARAEARRTLVDLVLALEQPVRVDLPRGRVVQIGRDHRVELGLGRHAAGTLADLAIARPGLR